MMAQHLYSDPDHIQHIKRKHLPQNRVHGKVYRVFYWYFANDDKDYELKRKSMMNGNANCDYDDYETDYIVIVKDHNGQEMITKQLNTNTGQWHYVFTLEIFWPGECKGHWSAIKKHKLQFFHEVIGSTEANDVRAMCTKGNGTYNKKAAQNLAESVYRQIRCDGTVTLREKNKWDVR